jgi:hypothetical protein
VLHATAGEGLKATHGSLNSGKRIIITRKWLCFPQQNQILAMDTHKPKKHSLMV